MNEINDRLEILIGRLVDGEISPGERQILERELDANSQAKELLEQLRSLRQYSQQAVAAEVSGGASADQIFERAWQQSTKSTQRIFRINGHLRFAVGLAAGLILGLALHFVPIWGGAGAPMQIPEQALTAREIGPAVGGPVLVKDTAGRAVSRPVNREVDWYVFTGPNGEQWLVEGVREGLVKTADFRGKPRPM